MSELERQGSYSKKSLMKKYNVSDTSPSEALKQKFKHLGNDFKIELEKAEEDKEYLEIKKAFEEMLEIQQRKKEREKNRKELTLEELEQQRLKKLKELTRKPSEDDKADKWRKYRGETEEEKELKRYMRDHLSVGQAQPGGVAEGLREHEAGPEGRLHRREDQAAHQEEANDQGSALRLQVLGIPLHGQFRPSERPPQQAGQFQRQPRGQHPHLQPSGLQAEPHVGHPGELPEGGQRRGEGVPGPAAEKHAADGASHAAPQEQPGAQAEQPRRGYRELPGHGAEAAQRGDREQDAEAADERGHVQREEGQYRLLHREHHEAAGAAGEEASRGQGEARRDEAGTEDQDVLPSLQRRGSRPGGSLQALQGEVHQDPQLPRQRVQADLQQVQEQETRHRTAPQVLLQEVPQAPPQEHHPLPAQHRKVPFPPPHSLRHEPQKKSAFYPKLKQSKPQSVLNAPSPSSFPKIVKRNKNLDFLGQELESIKNLSNLEKPLFSCKSVSIMNFKQKIYDAVANSSDPQNIAGYLHEAQTLDESLKFKKISQSIHQISEYRFNPSIVSCKELPTYQRSNRQKKPSIQFPKIHERQSQHFSPDNSLNQSHSDEQQSSSQISSQKSLNRYRTHKQVKTQRKIIKLLIDQMETAQQGYKKDMRHFSKQINFIEKNKDEDFQKFKVEKQVESLKFLDVVKRNFNFKKKTFMRKL